MCIRDSSNAAMEFNEQTLEPTYRLIHGLAGASSGLKIAERLRMPASVLSAATAFLDTGEADVALYVEELRRRITDLEAEKTALEAQRKEFESTKERELATLKAQQKEELARAERRVQEIATEMAARAARELETVQDEFLKKKYQRKLEATTAHATSQIRHEKEKVADRPQRPAAPDKPGERLPVEVGSRVRVDSLGVTGVVTSLQGNEAEVLVGNIRLRRPLGDLDVTEKPSLKSV